jgi:hypothetical protein
MMVWKCDVVSGYLLTKFETHSLLVEIYKHKWIFETFINQTAVHYGIQTDKSDSSRYELFPKIFVTQR